MIIGVSPSPTPYKITTLRADHYVRCGADILLNGLRINLAGEGRCIVCGVTIRLKMSEGKLREIEPETAVLHIVECPMGQGRIGIECEASPLFDNDNCLRAWLKSYNGRSGLILKPKEFLDRMVRPNSPVERN